MIMICPFYVIMSTDVVKIFRIYGSIQWFALTLATVVTLGNPAET